MTQVALPELCIATNQAKWRKFIVGLYVAIGTAIVMSTWLAIALESPQTGWDFPVFYIAAKLPIHLIYNHEAFASFGQQHLVPLGVSYYPPFFIRPSVFALFCRPIGMFGYWHAFSLWAGLNLSAYLVSAGILIRRFHLPAFLLPAYVAFFPAMGGLLTGQDCCVFLLAMIAGWLLLEAQIDWLAGAVLALCLYKFNLILLIPLMLVLQRRFRVLLTFAIGAIALATCSALLASPGEYVNVLINGPGMIRGFFAVGLRGFSQAIGQPWCYPVLATAVFVLCCWLMKRLPLTEAFCVAITGTLLISPYITWYDSALLALPLSGAFARSATATRVLWVATLVAFPLWEHGGGNNGPIGFMHVGIELLILGYFAHMAELVRWPSRLVRLACATTAAR